jgi:hypothetical protein
VVAVVGGIGPGLPRGMEKCQEHAARLHHRP